MSTTRTDLGPLLAAVTDEWERGLVIAERAGIDSRTAGPRLAALEREGMVAASWTDKHGGVRLYRRGPKAPAVQGIPGLRLVYKGDSDYDLVLQGAVIELSYDGTEYAVGDWTFWNVRIGDDRFGGTQHIGPGALRDWLEAEARRTEPFSERRSATAPRVMLPSAPPVDPVRRRGV